MIEDYTLEVLEAIEDSAKKTLPSVGGVGYQHGDETILHSNDT